MPWDSPFKVVAAPRDDIALFPATLTRTPLCCTDSLSGPVP